MFLQAAPSFSSECTFDTTISYTIVVLDNSGQVVKEEMVMSANCSAGFCSITFPTSDQYCGVMVRANNVFGESFAIMGNKFVARVQSSYSLATIEFQM